MYNSLMSIVRCVIKVIVNRFVAIIFKPGVH